MSYRTISTEVLTLEEQDAVLRGLQFLRAKLGGWKNVAKLVRFKEPTLGDVAGKRRGVSPELAFRVAKVVGVSISDLLEGRWPEPGTCPRCGYRSPGDGVATSRA
ncbi:MAG: hypothetical protein KIT84_44600 [Labilithrix sp.]|nr:hypothetical protein [Labilithrix sp.]MCW5818161.1 hypothetical protein [Labilithrix sp.]